MPLQQPGPLQSDAKGYLGRGVIYTASSGGVDAVLDPKHPIAGVDYVCFTDSPGLALSVWDVRPLDSVENDPVRRAKHPKICPHIYFPDHDWSLWIDANTVIEADIRDILSTSLQADMASFTHPERQCLFAEAQVCADKRKDEPEVIRRQTARYRAAGMPENFGLMEANILLRRHNQTAVREAMALWWSEITNGSRRDQISLPYVQWRTGLNLVPFFGGAETFRTQTLFKRTPHFVDHSRVGARIIYATEAALRTGKRFIAKATGPHHSVVQRLPIDFKMIESASFRIATHKGQALGGLTVALGGLSNANGSRSEPLAERKAPVSHSCDNRYYTIDFQGIDVSRYPALELAITSIASDTRPVSYFMFTPNGDLPEGHGTATIDGMKTQAQLCFAIQGR